MCMDDRKVWSRDLEKSNKPATLVGLMTWMTAEMKSCSVEQKTKTPITILPS